ncbi:uncharacterized protein K489DRAFT_384863 [Dissoconium aciculare CBS 342.82]|uniref:F-box domain-containing protein n=1 Tax=Dissoconium aciculare CBS 342.82 TaxID=1314786 RepID=A0A6J3LT27_9PEZI|nr:uncharacterized protein K489DRAFT_384863 [Dissoconium aciculare CBS 342.82]KAF1818439.1 hypothetical protein K489DRAFT_384863 [Dissoconium aciculare CBS 342.82]
MSHLLSLPAELIVQIMCECPDIRSLLHVASTCRSMQQVWLDNTAIIACSVLSFTMSELLEYVEIFGLQTDAMPQQSCQIQSRDLNPEIRTHLSFIERSAYAVTAIRESRMTKVGEVSLNSSETSFLAPNNGPPDARQGFLIIRRLVTGYDHMSLLSKAYAFLHGIPVDHIHGLLDVASALEEHCESHWTRMGIERQEPGPAYWQDKLFPKNNFLPLSWAFAVHVVEMECSWRGVNREFPVEEGIQREYQFMRDAFGRERMLAMFGEDKPPWTERRCTIRKKWLEKHPTEPDMGMIVGSSRSVHLMTSDRLSYVK